MKLLIQLYINIFVYLLGYCVSKSVLINIYEKTVQQKAYLNHDNLGSI